MYRLVEFANSAHASEAVEKLNGGNLNGRQVYLRFDRTNEPKPEGVGVFVGNLPWEATQDELLDIFASFRPIDCNIVTNMTGKSRGFAIVLFANNQDADIATERMNQYEFKGRILEVYVYVSLYSLFYH